MKIIKAFLNRISGRIDFSSSGKELLNVVYDRLKKQAPPRPQQANDSMRLIQEDFVASDFMPLAVTLISLKKASQSHDYFQSDDFEQLCERAADAMATIHAEASSNFTKMLPQFPGLAVTAGHGKNDASEMASEKISSALSLISSGRTLIPMDMAHLNLMNLIGEKLKINRFDAKKFFENL